MVKPRVYTLTSFLGQRRSSWKGTGKDFFIIVIIITIIKVKKVYFLPYQHLQLT